MGLGNLVRKVKRGFALRALLYVTKGLANGRYGRRAQWAWARVSGLKTYIGLAFILAGFGFGEAFNLGICDRCPEWNQALMAIGVVLAQIGLLDGANREDGPEATERTVRMGGPSPPPQGLLEPGSPEWLKAHQGSPHGGAQEDTIILPSGEYTKSQLESALAVAKSQAERREQIARRSTRRGTQG